MKKIYLVPNVLTAFGLTCGLYVIFRISVVPANEINETLLIAMAGLLLLAGFFDLLDGAVARAIKAESEFGSLFDSLADAISFGVAPSVIVLKTLSQRPGSFASFLITTAALLFSVCGVLRLVRFNVIGNQIKGNREEEAAYQKNFTGLPIPAAAAALVSLNLFLVSDDLKRLVSLRENPKLAILFFTTVILGYFMVSRWKFLSLKRLHIRVTNFQIVFWIVVISVVFFYGILNHFSTVFLIVSWSYIIVAWVLSIIRKISGRQSKTLEDFEPEEEDDDDLIQ